jgi:hypothetical protein
MSDSWLPRLAPRSRSASGGSGGEGGSGGALGRPLPQPGSAEFRSEEGHYGASHTTAGGGGGGGGRPRGARGGGGGAGGLVPSAAGGGAGAVSSGGLPLEPGVAEPDESARAAFVSHFGPHPVPTVTDADLFAPRGGTVTTPAGPIPPRPALAERLRQQHRSEKWALDVGLYARAVRDYIRGLTE